MSTAEAIVQELTHLTPPQQRQVLDYARSLTQPLPRGARVQDLRRFVGSIPADELDQMQEQIEQV